MNDSGDQFFNEPSARQKELCDKIAATDFHLNGIGGTIFPNTGDQSTNYGLNVTKAEIEAAKKVTPTKEELLVPFIVGCADYEYATALKHHQTRFIYMLQNHDRTLPPGIFPIRGIRVGHDVSGPDVDVSKWPFGGFDAY